ncbi:MAG: TRAP transporter small permease [Granulosicoccus sp.]|nr:TRAP transporter small permease [Granulosicoccus sp.]
MPESGFGLSAVRDHVLRVSSILLASILVALVGLECAQVVLRYLFGIGIYWAVDVAGLLLLSFGWLGASHLWVTRSHLEVDFLGSLNRIPQRLILAIGDLLVIAGIIWIFPQIMLTIKIYSGMTMPALQLSMAMTYIPPTIGLCLIGLSAVMHLVEHALEIVAET